MGGMLMFQQENSDSKYIFVHTTDKKVFKLEQDN